MSNRLEKRALRIFDDILKASNEIAKSWKLRSIPLAMFKQILDQAEVKVATMNLPGSAKELKDAYNQLLVDLYEVAQEKCKEMGTDHVNIQFIENCIIHIKQAWREGAEVKK
jgi:hypothetical protein